MTTSIFNTKRIKAVSAVLTNSVERAQHAKALTNANGDVSKAVSTLKKKLPAIALKKIVLAHSLADWSDDNTAVMKAFAKRKSVASLRDVALHFDAKKIESTIPPKSVPVGTPGKTAADKKRIYSVALHTKLFHTQTSAVLQRMVHDNQLPIADESVRSAVGNFLAEHPDFDIRRTSVYTALKNPDALKGVADKHRSAVVDQLKTLQRVQALAPTPEAVPALMKSKLTSAFQVAELPESTFMSSYAPALGADTAKQVYTNAINTRIRNERALMTMHESLRGSGLAIMDGDSTLEQRREKMQAVADQQAVPLNIETLFGSMDYCECDDCLSVYSPASYFVELLNYLRNNNLGSDPATGKPPASNPNIHNGYKNTPLEKLFRRRPDLGCLELTCENTFTVLPYIDLVNEVMESFVVHEADYRNSTTTPKQATLEVFNVVDETSSELLAQPQHVNFKAYCLLKSAKYPFTLPYHQPLDAIRIFLKYLGTSRYELLKRFRTADESGPVATLPAVNQPLVQAEHQIVMDRAADAEFLGLSQEEYIILTREAFWTENYFDLTLPVTPTSAEYQSQIGVVPVYEYYGYDAQADMFNMDETSPKAGLTFVKKQFLPRTGIKYTDLVALLQTESINPNYPQGDALSIMESIRFSYRYLQSLVNLGSNVPQTRFAKLVQFLQKEQKIIPALEAKLHPDPCHKPAREGYSEIQERNLQRWVYCYFERIGKLIVLESGEGPTLSVWGALKQANHRNVIGQLQADGSFVFNNKTIGHVAPDLQIISDVGNELYKFTDSMQLFVVDPDNPNTVRGYISKRRLYTRDEREVQWLPPRDTCDLDKVRLVHLDGSAVTVDEYDRMQRFIRLWHKLGWTIDEVDKALVGFAAIAAAAPGPAPAPNPVPVPAPGAPTFIGLDAFADTCADIPALTDASTSSTIDHQNLPCPKVVPAAFDISPDFIHELVAIKKLKHRSGLSLLQLLSFWADISTAGDNSLYATLFLTHNLLAIDDVFKADGNGNYLTTPARISDHIPVLVAALRLKADDVNTLMALTTMPDVLTLANVSMLYRYSLLARVLKAKVADLPEIVGLFGNPFTDATQTLQFLQIWTKVEDSGFSFRQLNYVVRGHDDPLRPLAPTLKNMLVLAKTLYDGLNAIVTQQPDVVAEFVTDDVIRTKAGLIFDQGVVEQIVELLNGTTVYTTNSTSGLNVTIPASLATKVKYIDAAAGAQLQVIGVLSAAEVAQALTVLPTEAAAFNRIAQQVQNFFNTTLSDIFANFPAAKGIVLGPDIIVSAAQLNALPADPNTASQKRVSFLSAFMPFLHQTLSHQLVVDTVSAASSLDGDVTDELLSNILTAGIPAQSAMNVLLDIKNAPAAAWNGYLLAPSNGAYSFYMKSAAQPLAITLDGQSIDINNQQADPNNVWWSKPVTLKAGKLYPLSLNGQSLDALSWRTAVAPVAPIPASALLPNYSSDATTTAFTKVYKAAILINGFALTLDEISYLQNCVDFDTFDLNAVTLQQWRRLQAYCALRDGLPSFDRKLIDLFAWANKPDPTPLSTQISAVTGWKQDRIDALLSPDHFDLQKPAAFVNEINLIKLQKALAVADKIGMDINRLFTWANPSSKFSLCHQIATDVQQAARARFDEDSWEQVVKPLNDQLRENQKQALIAYLLVDPDLIQWGVEDADSLFEFFLIDVQMCACLQTSRIKQAISTVQLFIQRCLLGLESPAVTADALDRDRWQWMQKYNPWRLNRSAFVNPESSIRSELRDDKTPFYVQLESDLLQKDITQDAVEDSFKAYLFNVDNVAHLQVLGFYEDTANQKLHVFARSHGAPYYYYYRYFDQTYANWYSWQKVDIDIPNYDVEDKFQVTANGSYLTPVVWNGRLLLFFPQITKKTSADTSNSSASATKGKNDSYSIPLTSPAIDFWEIKMCWSELRNGKWTQKQVSKDCINIDSGPLTPINQFAFVPFVHTSSLDKVTIYIFSAIGASFGADNSIGSFDFIGSQLYASAWPLALDNLPNSFNSYSGTLVRSLQIDDPATTPEFAATVPYFSTLAPANNDFVAHLNSPSVVQDFYHPFAHKLLEQLNTDRLENLFAYFKSFLHTPGLMQAFDTMYGGYKDNGNKSWHELKTPYAIYNWEAGFHIIMALVDKLANAQQFDQALAMCNFVFDPAAKGIDPMRFWQFPPFSQITAENQLEDLFLSLQPGTPNQDIDEWRSNPFEPHLVARSRPSAYMKWTVMKYIEILIAHGDFYFTQNTLETIPYAIQCYVLASHIYGPRAQKIPKRGKILPETYQSLLDKWDAFGNAMVELELAFPFSNQTSLPLGQSNGVVGLANVFGFATSLYFCIPLNPQLQALRDTIDDRLFKIRHCEDINGVFRQLPLFDAAIDEGLLGQAAAQGLSLASVLGDTNAPMPNYRFYYLLQKANELCNEVKALGTSYISAREKGDAEALASLRAAHDTSINTLILEVKTQQLAEAQKALDALQSSRIAPAYRLQHYMTLIGAQGSVPDTNSDFTQIADSIDAPVDDSGLKLSPLEFQEMQLAKISADMQEGIGQIETLASIMNMIPNFSVQIEPFGCGASISFGGSNIGAAMQAMARNQQISASNISFQSTNSGRKAGYQRQLQDRILQANIAGFEVKNIDKQILTQQIRIDIAQKEIDNQKKQIDNAQEIEDFLHSKYTNQELYTWMQTSVRGLYYQAYTLAYDLSKRAEAVFHLERQSDKAFVQFGYWDAGRDGLLAGERLQIALNQMESEYLSSRGYDYEVTKAISLRQLNPLALIELRETGSCEFSVPEILFDMDFPHFNRRIKNIALSVPCVVGPYTSLSGTLSLLKHQFRNTTGGATNKGNYPQDMSGPDPDPRFATTNIPISAIAASSGQNDAGMFELNFHDERYLPFEGAGAISTWRLEFSSSFRQFDYDTISDVILHMRYTSMDGGEKFKRVVSDTVSAYIAAPQDTDDDERGLFAAFDLRHDYPSEWYKASQAANGAAQLSITLVDLYQRLPIFSRGYNPTRKPAQIRATDVYVFVAPTAGTAAPSAAQITQGGNVSALQSADKVGEMNFFNLGGLINCPMDTWTLALAGNNLSVEKLWLIVRYVLT